MGGIRYPKRFRIATIATFVALIICLALLAVISFIGSDGKVIIPIPLPVLIYATMASGVLFVVGAMYLVYELVQTGKSAREEEGVA